MTNAVARTHGTRIRAVARARWRTAANSVPRNLKNRFSQLSTETIRDELTVTAFERAEGRYYLFPDAESPTPSSPSEKGIGGQGPRAGCARGCVGPAGPS